MAIETNCKCLQRLELVYCDVTPVAHGLLRLESDERNLIQMLVGAATLCNRILQVDLAERYLKVARTLTPRKSLTTSDICLLYTSDAADE